MIPKNANIGEQTSGTKETDEYRRNKMVKMKNIKGNNSNSNHNKRRWIGGCVFCKLSRNTAFFGRTASLITTRCRPTAQPALPNVLGMGPASVDT